MTQEKKLTMLEEMLEVTEGTLTPEIELAELEEWTSIAMIALMALVDEEFDRTIKATQIKNFKTVADILVLMEAE
jgi:acyl carrier protein